MTVGYRAATKLQQFRDTTDIPSETKVIDRYSRVEKALEEFIESVDRVRIVGRMVSEAIIFMIDCEII